MTGQFCRNGTGSPQSISYVRVLLRAWRRKRHDDEPETEHADAHAMTKSATSLQTTPVKSCLTCLSGASSMLSTTIQLHIFGFFLTRFNIEDTQKVQLPKPQQVSNNF